MKILFVGSSLTAGGAERVLTLLVCALAQRHEVVLATLRSATDDFFSLEPSVRRIALGLEGDSPSVAHAVAANYRRVKALAEVLRAERPDVIVSFLTQVNILALLAARSSGVPVIVAERSDPAVGVKGRFWRMLRKITYPRAQAVVVQTEAAAEWMTRLVRRERVKVIANPVPAPTLQGGAPAGSSAEPYIVAVGRLSIEKGFDLLLRAFASCRCRDAAALWILGDGAERANLEAEAARLGIASRVHFAGYVRNPATIVASAEMFVLPSRHEGFPNALTEAMALGLAAVAFDCPSGPREIVRDGHDGLLVENGNVAELASKIDLVFENRELRSRLGAEARNVVQRFSVERVVGEWERIAMEAA